MAGLRPPWTDDEPLVFFLKACAELGIKMPGSDREALWCLAESLAASGRAAARAGDDGDEAGSLDGVACCLHGLTDPSVYRQGERL